jgi:4-oxalocrotonate tautomerase
LTSRVAFAATIRCRNGRWAANGRVPTAGFCIRKAIAQTEPDASAPGNFMEETLMPYVTIVLREGRSLDQKRELVKAVTDALVRTVNAKPEAVHIVVHDEPAHNLAGGGQLLADRK